MSDRETAPYRRIADLERENAALREQIDDWENAVAHARDNRSEEQHCTCVAPLIGKVKQLERKNAALRAAAVETCALARVWATVWHDKLSTESLQRFAELEREILKGAQP
jgi:multidrug resistance efflux pump